MIPVTLNPTRKFSMSPVSPEKQNEILEFAANEQIKLSDALAYFNISHDSLIYRHSHEQVWSGNTPPILSDFRISEHQIPMVSFFTGCGGIDLGFEAAGFSHIAAFEFNEMFCQTLRLNRPEWKISGPPAESGDVSMVSKTIEILKTVIPVDFEGVFVGGPPCQPFSIASSQRFSKSSADFKRIGFNHKKNGNLLFDYVSLIKHFRPACFLIENVPGLRDMDGGIQLSIAINQLQNNGYNVQNPMVLNAADYGVPQFRKRLFVIGTRLNRPVGFPKPNNMHYGAGSVLPRIQHSGLNTETRVHGLNTVQRYIQLDYGQRDQIGRVNRLSPCLPAATVVAGGSTGGGRSHLHPEIPRTLSVRECAKLQTFPDDYVFVGPHARQFTQVGNAVPPVLAAQLGLLIANSVFKIRQF